MDYPPMGMVHTVLSYPVMDNKEQKSSENPAAGNGSGNLIERFSQYCRLELNRSALTVDTYCRDLLQFAGEVPDLCGATSGEIRGWLADEAGKGVKPVSLRRKTQSLRAFYRWLLRQGMIARNPAAEVTLAKAPKPLPQFAKDSELEALLAIPTETFEQRRSHLAVNMIYSLGLRQAELLGVHDTDITERADGAEIRITGNATSSGCCHFLHPYSKRYAPGKASATAAIPTLPCREPLWEAGMEQSLNKLFMSW